MKIKKLLVTLLAVVMAVGVMTAVAACGAYPRKVLSAYGRIQTGLAGNGSRF